ncbi:bifunctional DNA primase/polymerase [Nocardioides sp. NPDC051685]|uniref:bifunctional DNA primase/polymerase n=1 Tax=Nocardioides sp. NPDC051685 TaxID=3364334 RepID=UPI0037926EBD
MSTSNSGPSPWTATAFRDAARAPDLPSAALKLALARIPVFPCVPGSKNPLTAHGFQSATTNPQQVHLWWQRTPTANIGIPTGARSRLVVVDVDVHRAGDGFKNFARLTEMGLVSGWAWMVRTPSGGMHAYFAANPGGEQRCWSMPSRHIDFRGDGGYVVAPPSVVTNDDDTSRPYELIGFGSRPGIVDSAGLNHILAPSKPPPQLGGPPAAMPAAGTSPRRLADWVASRPEGARNGGLFWAACRMAEAGHNFNQTAQLLGEAAASAGLPDTEADRTIKSAYNTVSRLGPTNNPGSGPGPTTRTEEVAM